ncbi:sterile alpha motif domain-containing protein 3-like [Haemaphysalis longicornis]
MPDLQPYEQVLQRKTAISGNLRRFIVNKLFQVCWKITWYPTHELYQTAAQQLVSRYPHLIDRLDGRNGLDSWVRCLRNKFKNAQKETGSDTEPPNKKLCRLVNSSHLVVYGETEEAMMRHSEWLEENVGTTEDEAKRQRLLATANRRHKQLQTMTLQEALTTFPFLCVESTLLMEFEVVFQRQIADKMEAGFASLSDIVLKYGTEREVALFIEAAEEDGIRALLGFIVDRCGDSFDAILTEGDVPLTPCLHSDNGEVSLHVDGQRVFTASSLLAGLCSLFASFWVFNIHYPKKAHRVMTFVEHAFLDLASTKPRVKALELINLYRVNITH